MKPALQNWLVGVSILVGVSSFVITVNLETDVILLNARVAALEQALSRHLAASNSIVSLPPDTLDRLASNLALRIAPVPSATPVVPLQSSVLSSAGPGMNYYLIRPGDTLSSIAEHEGLSLDELIWANPRIDPDRLDVGQRIRIPLIPANP